MSEPWLSSVVLTPSAWRRRCLASAGAVCALVAVVLAIVAAQAAATGESPSASLLAGVLASAFASAAALNAAGGSRPVGGRLSRHLGWLAPADSAGRDLRIDSRGRIELGPAPAGTSAARGGDSPEAPDEAPATALCIGPLFVVLQTTGGRAAMVWCDSLPRVGFRRLVVAARWGAGSGATESPL